MGSRGRKDGPGRRPTEKNETPLILIFTMPFYVIYAIFDYNNGEMAENIEQDHELRPDNKQGPQREKRQGTGY
jgi:hypothetical protein